MLEEIEIYQMDFALRIVAAFVDRSMCEHQGHTMTKVHTNFPQLRHLIRIKYMEQFLALQ